MVNLCLECGHNTHSYYDGHPVCDKCGHGRPKPRPDRTPRKTRDEILHARLKKLKGAPMSDACKRYRHPACTGKYKAGGQWGACICKCHDGQPRFIPKSERTVKSCAICKVEKPVTDFYKNTANKWGSYCKPCQNVMLRAWRAAKRQEAKE